MSLPAALTALAAAAFGAVLYWDIPGGRQVGVAYWVIAGGAFALARVIRRRPRHRAPRGKRAGRTRT